MNTIWSSLLWKEWREHRWKIALLAAGALLLMPAPWMKDTTWHSAIDVIGPLLMLLIPLMAMFLGASIAAGEQSQRTIGFLQALPVTIRRPAMAKLFLALVAVWTPCLLIAGITLLWRRNESVAIDVPPAWALVGVGFVATSLLIWMAAVGVNRSDEVRAAAIGLLAILSYWAVLGFFISPPDMSSPLWSRLAFAAGPAGISTVLMELENQSRETEMTYSPVWPLIVAALLSNGAMLAWYVARFGRIAAGRRQAIEPVPAIKAPTWLAPPRRSPWSAILWKQMRETLPLAALGAAAILSIAGVIAATAINQADGQPWEKFAHIAGAVWIMTGFFVSIVAGVGLLMDDLRPGLHAFWRSRPIDPDQWFGVKFVASLLMTIVTLAVPPAVIYGVVVQSLGWERADSVLDLETTWSVFGYSLLAQTGAFCLAAAMMALVRQPVMAALITILTAVTMAAAFSMLSQKYGGPTPPMSAALVGLLTLAAAFVAWLAVRNDWGWNR